MCYVAIVAKVNDQRDETVEDVMRGSLYQKAISNGDGFGFLGITGDRFEGKRTMDISSARRFLDEMISSDFLGVHFRIATHGEKNESNIHWWKIGKWAFAHNGSVWGEGAYSWTSAEKLGEEKADSLKFFEGLVEILKKNKKDFPKRVAQLLRNHIDKDRLYGRGFLIDLEKKLVYGFGDLQAYLLNGSYMAICSADTTWDCVDYTTFGDLFFEEERSGAVKVLHSKIEGYWVWNIETRKMKLLETEEWVDKKKDEKKDEEKDKPTKALTPLKPVKDFDDEDWRQYQSEQDYCLGEGYGRNEALWDNDDQEMFATAYKVNSFLARGFNKKALYYKNKLIA